jgi:CheY-like chemotaxis protein
MNGNGTEMTNRGPRVLVVDDDIGAAQSLARVLAVVGCERTFIVEPAAAVTAAARLRADVAFVSIALPGIYGFEVAGQLRQAASATSRRRLALVAITAVEADEDGIQMIRQAGFDAQIITRASATIIAATLQKLFTDMRLRPTRRNGRAKWTTPVA